MMAASIYVRTRVKDELQRSLIKVVIPHLFQGMWRLRLRLRLGVWFMWLASKIIGCRFQVERRQSNDQEEEEVGQEEQEESRD